MRLVHPNKHLRLLLPAPEGASWAIRHVGTNLTEADVEPGVMLRVRAQVAPSIEHLAWIEGVMREDLAPGHTIEAISVASRTSARGWPVAIAHYVVKDGARVQPVEERAGVFYAIVHTRAEVVVRFTNGITWAQKRAQLEPYMLSAHVQWPEYDGDLLYTQLGFAL